MIGVTTRGIAWWILSEVYFPRGIVYWDNVRRDIVLEPFSAAEV